MLEEGALARARRAAPRSSRCSAGPRARSVGYQLLQHLVVVPQHHLRHLGVEAPHVLVEQVVEVVAAELLERLGHLRLGGRHEVAPDRAVVERHLRGERAVRVDRVAAVDEHVRLEPPHRLVAAQAAARGVDAPALADGVRGPGEPHVARGGGRTRAGAGRVSGSGPAPAGSRSGGRRGPGTARGRRSSGPAGRPDRSTRAVKPDSGSAAGPTMRRTSANDSRVDHSTTIRAGRSRPAPDDRAVAGHVADHGAVRHRRARARRP